MNDFVKYLRLENGMSNQELKLLLNRAAFPSEPRHCRLGPEYNVHVFILSEPGTLETLTNGPRGAPQKHAECRISEMNYPVPLAFAVIRLMLIRRWTAVSF